MLTSEQRPMLRFLIVQTAASVVGLQCWMILFNNFAVEVAGLNGLQVYPAGSLDDARFGLRTRNFMGVMLVETELATEAALEAAPVAANPSAAVCVTCTRDTARNP